MRASPENVCGQFGSRLHRLCADNQAGYGVHPKEELAISMASISAKFFATSVV